MGAYARFLGSFKPHRDTSASVTPMSRAISLGPISMLQQELPPHAYTAHPMRHAGCSGTRFGMWMGCGPGRGCPSKEYGNVGSAKVSRRQGGAEEAAADTLFHNELPPPNESGGHAAERRPASSGGCGCLLERVARPVRGAGAPTVGAHPASLPVRHRRLAPVGQLESRRPEI